MISKIEILQESKNTQHFILKVEMMPLLSFQEIFGRILCHPEQQTIFFSFHRTLKGKNYFFFFFFTFSLKLGVYCCPRITTVLFFIFSILHSSPFPPSHCHFNNFHF